MYSIFLFKFGRTDKKAGFTLVEALTGIIILSICAAALFSALNQCLNMVQYIRESVIASSIIQEEMEELRKTAFTALPPAGVTAISNGSLSSLYNASGTIKIDQYSGAEIVRAVITVTWYTRLRTGKQNTKRVVMLISKNGINSL